MENNYKFALLIACILFVLFVFMTYFFKTRNKNSLEPRIKCVKSFLEVLKNCKIQEILKNAYVIPNSASEKIIKYYKTHQFQY